MNSEEEISRYEILSEEVVRFEQTKDLAGIYTRFTAEALLFSQAWSASRFARAPVEARENS